MGQATKYKYDSTGNLVEKDDAKGQKTLYAYDPAKHLTEINYYSSTDYQNPTKTVDFTYDSVGNLTSYNDGISSAAYAYDSLRHKVSENVVIPSPEGAAISQSYSYTYYPNGKKQSMTYPDGTTYDYTYDGANNLTGINVPVQIDVVTFPKLRVYEF
jgi:YD repeat-containing protein